VPARFGLAFLSATIRAANAFLLRLLCRGAATTLAARWRGAARQTTGSVALSRRQTWRIGSGAAK
jgi:hypothetical protein